MDENEFAGVLKELLAGDESDVPEVRSVCSFERAGLLTRNTGIVVRLESGEEFQVTIVRSR